MFGVSLGIMDGAGGAAGGSFESIATVTGNGSSATLSFTSIASTYKHLQIRGIAKDTYSAGVFQLPINIQFNGDTTNSYALHNVYGNGSASAAQGFATGSYNYVRAYSGSMSTDASLTNVYGVSIIDLHNYSSTTSYKTMRAFSGADANGAGTPTSTGRIYLSSGLWLNTAAISQIDLKADGTAFANGTVFSLYGIAG